uniref:Uncharacterized protein n=1 Tax=Rangifer tarandus platyrhynchus TaxID=3082113 RepID=A0ACB0F0A0_RANTA|nr:unnamed protein product [Rangifer tarandus platyrhynchus]
MCRPAYTMGPRFGANTCLDAAMKGKSSSVAWLGDKEAALCANGAGMMVQGPFRPWALSVQTLQRSSSGLSTQRSKGRMRHYGAVAPGLLSPLPRAMRVAHATEARNPGPDAEEAAEGSGAGREVGEQGSRSGWAPRAPPGTVQQHTPHPSQGPPPQKEKARNAGIPEARPCGALRPSPDYILFPIREMTLAHCSGAKQTPPTISWAWALRADARRNLKEAGYFGC